jgi:hypothetical protein
MTLFQPTRALLLLALAAPVQSADTYVPWPNQEQLKEIQNAAFSCSRENNTANCSRTRQLADPLMDHPLLPGLCKDVLWNLMEQAVVVPNNTYKRRDAIDNPARRIGRVCAKPKKKADPKPSPGAPQMRQS